MYDPETIIKVVYLSNETLLNWLNLIFEIGIPTLVSIRCQTSPASYEFTPSPISNATFTGLLILKLLLPKSIPLILKPDLELYIGTLYFSCAVLIISYNLSADIFCLLTGIKIDP